MKALQELVPDSNKVCMPKKDIFFSTYELGCFKLLSLCACGLAQTDKASMLDEIIGYVKFLQMQVKVALAIIFVNCETYGIT